MLIFHEIATFWDFAEALKEIRKTYLLAMLLSRWAVHDSTDSKSLLWICQRSNFNQFTVNVSEFTAYWLKLVNDLVES